MPLGVLATSATAASLLARDDTFVSLADFTHEPWSQNYKSVSEHLFLEHPEIHVLTSLQHALHHDFQVVRLNSYPVNWSGEKPRIVLEPATPMSGCFRLRT